MVLLSYLAPIAQWLDAHRAAVALIVAISAITFLATLVLIPILLMRIPPDYFSESRAAPTPWKHYHPVLRMTALAAKNAIGGVLVLAGLVMLFTPGQGIITLLIGLALVDLPGKRALERWIVSRPRVLSAINRLRARHGQPPLEQPR
jgi:hypothetical protein